jgi:hypothetical protein
MENISGETLGVNSNQRWRGGHIAQDQRDGFFDALVSVRSRMTAEAIDPEISPTGGKISGCDLLNSF